jgi:glutamate synthase domain-containing protein 3
MMRKCHLNTCPVGIATQDPVLRAKFSGKPEHVIRFMFYVAEEVRTLMASLGFRTMNEMVGRADRLRTRTSGANWKAERLDFSDVLHVAEPRPGVGLFKCVPQDHGLEKALDNKLIELCEPALARREPVSHSMPIKNVDRTVGAMLAGEVARRYGRHGLPPGTIELKFQGSAGQSFGAFITNGITLELEGDGNDYVGKGMAGGTIVVRAPDTATFRAEENILIGNVALYGATSGKAFFAGRAGERFSVRNSGATAVVEGVGDHCCEYMTGGRVLVLGRTGRNFAAGMSGGYAYVFDETGDFEKRCNLGMVELEALSPEDAAFVAALIEEHRDQTGSRRAVSLLSDWEKTLTRMLKVVPLEYRRVLEELSRAREKSATSHALPVLQTAGK